MTWCSFKKDSFFFIWICFFLSPNFCSYLFLNIYFIFSHPPFTHLLNGYFPSQFSLISLCLSNSFLYLFYNFRPITLRPRIVLTRVASPFTRKIELLWICSGVASQESYRLHSLLYAVCTAVATSFTAVASDSVSKPLCQYTSYGVITNDVSDYINVLLRTAHIICNHLLFRIQNRLFIFYSILHHAIMTMKLYPVHFLHLIRLSF